MPERFDRERDSIETILIKASFAGANADPIVAGVEEMEYKCNYLIGDDPKEWHTGVPSYQYLLYENVYPDIDLKYDGSGSSYVIGLSGSYDFPTQNPYQTDQSYRDVFVVKLSDEPFFCGDADGNGIVNISDAVFLITYVLGDGPAPDPLEAGDLDCQGSIHAADIAYLIAYIFGGGPEPCADCP